MDGNHPDAESDQKNTELGSNMAEAAIAESPAEKAKVNTPVADILTEDPVAALALIHVKVPMRANTKCVGAPPSSKGTMKPILLQKQYKHTLDVLERFI